MRAERLKRGDRALHTARLLKLARIVEDAKARRFNMQIWARHKGKHLPEERNYCGTTACALGHGALDSEFQAAGLKLRWIETDPNEWSAEVGFAGYDGSGAGAAFFGLTCDEAYDVFLRTERSRKEVVVLIRQYAKQRRELSRDARVVDGIVE